MRIFLVAGLFFPGSSPLIAQATTEAGLAAAAPTPGPAPEAARAHASAPAAEHTPAPLPQVQNSGLGFSYALPGDWEFVAPPPPPPAEPYPDLPPAAKKGNTCVEIALTARHGSPASVVVVVALPFGCFGQSIAQSALPGLASGVEEGFKESFELVDPVNGTYALGSHAVWIERSKGTPKGQPQAAYTFEIACTVLKKGAVCWMAMAADEDSLKTFEQQAVTLEGDSFGALAPMDRIQFEPVAKPQKPS